MIKVMAIALFLFGAAQSVAGQAQDTNPTPREALVALLKDLAKVRVEFEQCHGAHPSSVRNLTESTVKLAETFKLMPRSEAVDIVNDEQILERIRTGRRCGSSAIAAFKASSAAFDKAIGH